MSDPRSDDWGGFGEPLFDDPSVRALSRVGVIDIGSNSVRFVVFDGAARSPAYFFNEKVMAGLGAGLGETGVLNPEGRKRALAAIKRFTLTAQALDVSPLSAVATAAVRDAKDGEDFQSDVEKETGLKLRVIDGEEEALLSAQGVLLGWPEAEGVICDIGGSSMELAIVKKGRVGKRISTPLGPLKLQTIKGGEEERSKVIKRELQNAFDHIGKKHSRLYLVGGSWRAIARIDMVRQNYPMTVLHEYRMTAKHVNQTLAEIKKRDAGDLRALTGIGAERMLLVPTAAEVLGELVDIMQPEEIDISSYGIREGLLYEHMPDKLRDRDPLIESCRWAEAQSARIPGFGKKLYGFILPLFPDFPYVQRRIIKAACLLHDVSWRSHPDYRHEVCFEYATRANMGGLKHSERVYLGLALLHRYKNSRSGSRFHELFQLIPEDKAQEAEVLGKAMRFGAMFPVQSFDEIGSLQYDPKKSAVKFLLQPDARPLFGEVAEARFNSLAKSLNAKTVEVTVNKD